MKSLCFRRCAELFPKDDSFDQNRDTTTMSDSTDDSGLYALGKPGELLAFKEQEHKGISNRIFSAGYAHSRGSERLLDGFLRGAISLDYPMSEDPLDGDADGPILKGSDLPKYPTAEDPWYRKNEVQKAIETGSKVLRMYRDHLPFSDVKEYLETYVWRFAPGAGEKKSGGSVAKYAKDHSFTRTLPVQ